MRFCAAISLILSACIFDPSTLYMGSGSDAQPNPDAPPAATEVRFVSVTTTTSELRPGLYGIEVTAVLQNDFDVELTEVAASLTFADDSSDRAGDFRWRDFDMREGAAEPNPATVGPAAQATFRFRLDALPSAVPPGPIAINGSATFTTAGERLSATPLDPPLSLEFAALNNPIVVNNATDEDDTDNDVCLREALLMAIAAPGLDRITFDPAQFPAGSTTTSLLDEQLGALPVLDGTGGDLIIDGSDAGFELAADSNWESPEGRYGLRITGGSLVVHNIGFRDLGYNYPNEGDLSGNNCGPLNQQLGGGPIRVDGGTLILDGNRFADPNVAERNCYAASVRIHGGTGHRIVGNTWTEPSMDSLYIDGAVIEVSDNVMDAESDVSKADECIFVESQGGSDLWITGNLCVDQEYSGVIARGTDSGTLYVVNNTFVRNGRVGLSAVRRNQGARAIVLRNNAYLSNNPAALNADNSGTGFDLAYETTTDSTLCNSSCPNATIDTASMLNPDDLQVANPAGVSLADFTPQAGSPLIDSGLNWLDRNGSTPGRHNGTGPERGAVELP